MGCNKIDCSDLKYENRITTLNGKLFTGKCHEYYSNGQISSIQKYLDGKDHGSWNFYYSNGNKRTEAFFNYGKRINSWNYYSKSGFIYKINYFDSLGKPTGIWKTYDTLNGKLLKETDSKDIKFN